MKELDRNVVFNIVALDLGLLLTVAFVAVADHLAFSDP